MKRRTVISEHAPLHCATCRQSVRRVTIIEGRPYCSVHAAELTATARSSPLVTALKAWLGHGNEGYQARR